MRVQHLRLRCNSVRLGLSLKAYFLPSEIGQTTNSGSSEFVVYRERGIRPELSVSGAGQNVAIRRSLEVRRDGQRVFDSIQATWNLFERGAESALENAHGTGMKVVVKESLANGRLTHRNRDDDEVLAPLVARIRELAEARGTTIEMLALAAALELVYDAELEEQLRSAFVSSTEYWRARSSFRWN